MNCKESAISNYFFLELDYLMGLDLSKPYFKPINQHSILLCFFINRFDSLFTLYSYSLISKYESLISYICFHLFWRQDKIKILIKQNKLIN